MPSRTSSWVYTLFFLICVILLFSPLWVEAGDIGGLSLKTAASDKETGEGVEWPDISTSLDVEWSSGMDGPAADSLGTTASGPTVKCT